MSAAQPLPTNSSSRSGRNRREVMKTPFPGTKGGCYHVRFYAIAKMRRNGRVARFALSRGWRRPAECNEGNGARASSRPRRDALLQVLVHELRHLEHVDGALAPEHRLERRVGVDVASVLFVLESVLLDVSPELLGRLSAGDR